MNDQRGLRLLQASLNMRRLLNRLASAGDLTQGEFLVLRHIWLANTAGPSNSRRRFAKAAELSDQLNRPRPAITRILNDLEERGLITRAIDPEDRRSINISLTAAGEAALQKANETILQLAERIAESLGESDTEKLIQLLDKLARIYEDVLGEAAGDAGKNIRRDAGTDAGGDSNE